MHFKDPRCLVWVGRSHPTQFCGVSRFGWAPFLRPGLTSPGRRAEPRSRMVRPFAGHRALARRAASWTAASAAPGSSRSGTLPRTWRADCYPLQTAKKPFPFRALDDHRGVIGADLFLQRGSQRHLVRLDPALRHQPAILHVITNIVTLYMAPMRHTDGEFLPDQRRHHVACP